MNDIRTIKLTINQLTILKLAMDNFCLLYTSPSPRDS